MDPVHTDFVNSVAFSSNGSCIISGSDDNSVQVWDALIGKKKHVLNGHTGLVNSVAFSSDGSYIVSGSKDKSVRVWDVLTDEGKHLLNGHTDSVNSVTFQVMAAILSLALWTHQLDFGMP